MSNETMNTDLKTPPLFQLSALFNPDNVNKSVTREVITGSGHTPDWAAEGLNVKPFDKATKEAIILSLFQDEVSSKIKFLNGAFFTVISAPEIFHLICSKIDELRPVNSPEKFFYNVLTANELFELFLKGLSANPYKKQ